MTTTPFTDAYDWEFLLHAMMGPNAMRITEEMAAFLPLAPGMRILDLGCGMGISSIVLAAKYKATVFAADLWITPTDNAGRFAHRKLENSIFPFLVDATRELPFAHDYFDMLVCVDAYQYFGAEKDALPRLLRYVKPGGYIAVAVPGLRKDFGEAEVPEELRPYWVRDINFYSCSWWRAFWQHEPGLTITQCREMTCCRQAWADWLQSPNPYAQRDIAMMEAEGSKYFTLVQIIGKKE